MSIYLDSTSHGKISPSVMEKMLPFFSKREENASSDIQEALRSLYHLVQARPEDQFLLTSSGAESINHVILAAYMDITRKTGKNHFVAAPNAEPTILLAMSRLSELGCHFECAPIGSKGFVTFADMVETISPRTALISLSAADHETGVIHPELPLIAKMCKERGILFHVDVTHVLGKIDFDFHMSGADVITFNGEQIGAPKGSGGIFLREYIELSPLIIRASEEIALAQLIALGAASKEALESRGYLTTEIALLKAYFEEQILEHIENVTVLFDDEHRVPHITSLDFKKIYNEALICLLREKKLYAIAHAEKLNTVCFSLHPSTTREQIDQAVSILLEACQLLRSYSHAIEVLA
jgi:cysteine desulfurase